MLPSPKPQRRSLPGKAGAWGLLACFGAGSVAADGSVWLPDPQTGYASLSFVLQSADEFYRAAELRPTPGDGEDLSQGTVWLNLDYAFADGWAIDGQTGWARSSFITGPGIPATVASPSGVVDSRIGITRRLVDEVSSALPSIAVRIGSVVAGNYETGHINSLGDGGSGYEASVIAGRFLGGRVGVNAEFGYRDRGDDIPVEHFANITSLLLLGDTLTVALEYRWIDSRSGLDIEEPPFTPTLFPAVQEDQRSIGLRIFTNLGAMGVNVFCARVVDGRNTAASDIFGVTLSRPFGAF